MSKTLDKIRALPFVAYVDDERNDGNGIIVTLKLPYCFKIDPGCGVRGFDTVGEAAKEVTEDNVYRADEVTS